MSLRYSSSLPYVWSQPVLFTMWQGPLPPTCLSPGPVDKTDVSPRDPRTGLVHYLSPLPGKFLWLPNLNCVHTNKHASLTPSILLGMRTSALNFTFWHQTSVSPRRSVTITHYSLTGLFSRRNKKEKKKTTEELLAILPLGKQKQS